MRLPGYAKAFDAFLYPIYNRFIGRDLYGFAAARIESETFSTEKIENVQLQKLKKVLENAEKHVPFYRENFAEIGFSSMALQSLEEFRQLEFFVTKSDVRSKPDQFIATNCNRKKLNWHRTGGSTGEPLYFATDPLTDAASAAAMSRALRWWGAKFGDRHAIFWGSPTWLLRRVMFL